MKTGTTPREGKAAALHGGGQGGTDVGASPSSLALCYASDDRGFVPLCVAVYSALSTAKAGHSYRIYILCDGLSEQHRAQILAMAAPFPRHAVHFLDVQHLLVDLCGQYAFKTTQRWPLVAWSRIFLPDLLPGETRVIYGDIDTLACRDLMELYRVDLGGKALGAVLEHYSHEGSHFNGRLGIPQTSPGYFNSGVLVMDLARFREKNLTERIVRYAAAYEDALTCPDQDALNGALHDEVTPLHPKWNWHDGLSRGILRNNPRQKLWRGSRPRQAVEAALYPGILHYMGPHKPWRYNYRMEGPRYLRALRASGALQGPLPGRTWKSCLKKWAYTPLYALTRWKTKLLARRWNVTGVDSRPSRGEDA